MLLAHHVPVAEQSPAVRRRRVLQLCLAGLWLLDGVLQVQVFMFGRGFADSVADAAGGNPALIAGPVSWASRLIGAHGSLATIAIAVIEVLLGLGIAWRPTVRLALAASVAWSLGVWWLGEGLGGLLTPDANLIAGAPGAVIIYAMLAVVLWPASAGARQGTGTGARTASGSRPAAKALWLLLWGGLAVVSLWQAAAAPEAIRRWITEMSAGQPRWLASADSAVAAALAHHGAQLSLALAGVLTVIAAAVFMPDRIRRAVLGVAGVLSVLVWTIGQGFGGVLTGMATDPNSGLLLLLTVAAYWPVRAAVATEARAVAAEARAVTAEALAVAARPARGAGSASGSRGWIRRDIDVMNALMAIAMASMLAGRLNPVLQVIWLLTFAVASAWFAAHAVRVWLRRAAAGQHVMHLLSCGGMLVMLVAPSAGAGAMGAAASGGSPSMLVPALAAGFAVTMAGSVVVLTDRLPVLGAHSASAGEPPPPAQPAIQPAGQARDCAKGTRRPALRSSCQVALGIAMACMLIQML
jgi:hypothetical protein